ncbi:MAG: FKBP-type peptidyl-prolyl cis-trans isomerase [Lachnospiraceae bacterium]|nr:FKBP-type peptidyl-prolyl cis-trans isomerase [Lachnospiraceae bacterium]
MALGKKKQTEELSASMEKRVARRKEVEGAKRRALIWKCVAIVLLVAVLAVIGFYAGRFAYYKITATKESSDYSAGLNEDGTIAGITDINKYSNPANIEETEFALSDLEYTDESVEADIETELNSHKELVTDPSVTVADGDTVNIDYVGTVDGVAFDGGSTDGNGTDLEIGSGSYVDDFEDQLIGTHPGDEVTISVTFPEDYGKEELNGKDAEFALTVNGVYQTPEFDDAFVQEYLSDYADTAEGYRQYLKDTNYDSKLEEAVTNYVSENSTAKKQYGPYLKAVRSLQKFINEQNLAYYSYMYQMYGMEFNYTSYQEYAGLNDMEYEKQLRSDAEKTATTVMAYQALFEKYGLSVSEEEYNAYVEELGGEESASNYGKGYIMQMLRQKKVTEHLKSIAVVK